MNRRSLILAGFVLLFAWPVAAARRGAPDTPAWNQWRGPGRDGKIPGFRAPAKWPAQLTRRWKIEVGIGHSSPLAAGENVYDFTREGDDEVVRCLELATGKQVWRVAYPAPYTLHPAAVGHGLGPKSTPVLAGGRLYTLGISGILSCLDAKTGAVVWRRDFVQEYPKTAPLFGAATSPIVDRGLLIAHVGGHDKGALTAFDAATGEVRWRWDGDGPGYASPLIVERGGVRQVVTQTQKLCVGVSAEKGELLWSVPFTTPFVQNIITPVEAGDLLVFGGVRQPTFALRITRDGSAWKTEKVWETNEATFYMSTPVFSDGRLYGMSERQGGQMVALDAATGKTLWTGDARFSTSAAVLDAGPVLLALTTDADVVVFKKEGPQLTQAAKYQVAESPTWATPAVAGNRILVKDLNSLGMWEIGK